MREIAFLMPSWSVCILVVNGPLEASQAMVTCRAGRQAEFSHTHMQTKFGSLCAMQRRRTTLETFLAAPGVLSSTQRSLIFWELEAAVSRIQKGCLVALAIQYYSSSWLRFSGGWKWQKNDEQKHKELLEAERSKCVAGGE